MDKRLVLLHTVSSLVGLFKQLADDLLSGKTIGSDKLEKLTGLVGAQEMLSLVAEDAYSQAQMKQRGLQVDGPPLTQSPDLSRCEVVGDGTVLTPWFMPRFSITNFSGDDIDNTTELDPGLSGGVGMALSGGFGINAALDYLLQEGSDAFTLGLGVSYAFGGGN